MNSVLADTRILKVYNTFLMHTILGKTKLTKESILHAVVPKKGIICMYYENLHIGQNLALLHWKWTVRNATRQTQLKEEAVT